MGENMLNKEYVIFGAGNNAKKIINLLGKEKVIYIVDNDILKAGTQIEGITVFDFTQVKKDLFDKKVIISVSNQYQKEIQEQLKRNGITSFETINEVQTRKIKEKIESRIDYIKIYNKAVEWVKNNTLNGEAVICNTEKRKGYPEVTGYYIPTLLRWGYRDLAKSYAKWLCEIQKDDGSWYDTDDRAPYVFDSAQILKGLLAIREILPEVDEYIIKGCDWIVGNIEETGRLSTPSKEAWGDEGVCSELIHLYCLSPLIEAGDKLRILRYKECALNVLKYYKENKYDDIMNFSFLSHFYAYVMEALLDLGEIDMARAAMDKVAVLQKNSGAVPAYNDVNWVCSTGLFQFSLVWFRLGDLERGRKAFEYACKLQNDSGGWFGSYLSETSPLETNNYFPFAEISWANKYFLDAFYYKNVAEFNAQAEFFIDYIDKSDERYRTILEVIKCCSCNGAMKILDVGCGKGRYLHNLVEDAPTNDYYAVDLSEKVMENINSRLIHKKQGALTNIPYDSNTFDITYSCEALEHAIDVGNAIKEMAMVTKSKGKIIVIDKNKDSLGMMEIDDCEQWFDEQELKNIMMKYCSQVEIRNGLKYENITDSNMFTAWIGTVK